MSKNSIKFFILTLILTGSFAVILYKSPVARTTFAAFDGKELPKKVTLNKDSATEYGDVAFDHESHSFKKYSVDGKTDISCAECHHTDQPKADLKPPLVTSERDVALTVDALKKPGARDVKDCNTCHFRENDVPEGKEIPSATYKDDKGKADTKELTNELAFHINCNNCHNEAAKLRPELKKKPGFATEKDCLTCHTKN